MIALLLACAGSAPPHTTAPDASFTDPEAPWLGAPDDTPLDVDAATVARAIEAAFAALDRIDPAPLLAAYDHAIADSEPGCPSYFTSPDGIAYWLDTCEAASGARYEGFGTADVTPGVPLELGLVGTMTTIGGSGTMSGADGGFLEMNGFVQHTTAVAPTVSFESVLVSGTFETDDAVAVGTWLDETWEPELTLLRYDFPDVGSVRAAIGVIEGLPVDGDEVPVVLQDVIIGATATGFTDCELESTGVISVRLAGGWVDVIFDPIDTGDGIATPAGACDGCGEAWAGITSLGPVCPDVTDLFGD